MVRRNQRLAGMLNFYCRERCDWRRPNIWTIPEPRGQRDDLACSDAAIKDHLVGRRHNRPTAHDQIEINRFEASL